jgi:hypothetical protein
MTCLFQSLKKVTLGTASTWVSQVFGKTLDSECIVMKLSLSEFLDACRAVIVPNEDLVQRVLRDLAGITDWDAKVKKIQGNTKFKGSKEYTKEPVELGKVGSVMEHHLAVFCDEAIQDWDPEYGFLRGLLSHDEFVGCHIKELHNGVKYSTFGLWGIQGHVSDTKRKASKVLDQGKKKKKQKVEKGEKPAKSKSAPSSAKPTGSVKSAKPKPFTVKVSSKPPEEATGVTDRSHANVTLQVVDSDDESQATNDAPVGTFEDDEEEEQGAGDEEEEEEEVEEEDEN